MDETGINLRQYRPSAEASEWELPPWGHPISYGVLPMFIGIHGQLHPIGTAFTNGRLGSFAVTATHNVMEAVKADPRLDERLGAGTLGSALQLGDGLSLYVLHQHVHGTKIDITLRPFETFDGATPGDVVFGALKAATIRSLVLPLTFDLPWVGSTVLSVGYADYQYPKGGISFELAASGRFDWMGEYRHRLMVAEGRVDRVFTQRFAAGFVGGPCFAFSGSIRHAMSGGPIFNEAGMVCGVNSAGAGIYFPEPMSLGSLLYPMLGMNLRFGFDIGPVRLNANRPLADFIAQGALVTDGSETHVGMTFEDGAERPSMHPRSRIDDRAFVHDDFAAYQAGSGSTKLDREFFVFKRPDP